MTTPRSSSASGVVLAVAPEQRTNGERVADLARLGYLPEPVLDPTHGRGGMWTRWRPNVLVRSDLRARDRRGPLPIHLTADFRALPFADATFGSVMFDPPYRLAGTATDQGGMDERFGIDRYRSVAETHRLILDGLDECARVVRPRGFVIVKCQDQVCSGRVWWQTGLVSEYADEECGLRLVDLVHLLSRRQQPPRKCSPCKGSGVVAGAEGEALDCARCDGSGRVPFRQRHAARNLSTFLVFRRPV